MDGDLEAALGTRVEAVNAALKGRLTDDTPEPLYAAARHLLDAGGKRIRPVMLLLVTEACGCPREPYDDRMPAALAVELVHTLSLIHDDIIDEDELRRGVPAVHVEWDDPLGILAGDLLYSEAFDVLAETDADVEDKQDCFQTLTRACRELCEGQALDIDLAEQSEVGEDRYITMVEKKTGALFACATRMGAILGDGNQRIVDSLEAYGRKLGVAFQLYDDVLDLQASSETLGKSRGSDIEQGKQTLITIHGRRHGVDVRNGDGPDSVERQVEELAEAGSIDYARQRAQRYVEEAKAQLDVLPETTPRDHLSALAEHVVQREF